MKKSSKVAPLPPRPPPPQAKVKAKGPASANASSIEDTETDSSVSTAPTVRSLRPVVKPVQEATSKLIREQKGQKFFRKNRHKWTSHFDAIFFFVGMAVGTFNILTFPLKMYKNGRIAFMIPYLVCLSIIAYPSLYLEMLLGQFVQEGGLGVWKIVPIFKGVGYAKYMTGWSLSFFYTTNLAWALVYAFDAGTDPGLRFAKCNNTWNTPRCITPTKATFVAVGYDKLNLTTANVTTAGEEYFRGRVLRIWPSEFADEGDLENVKQSLIPHHGHHGQAPTEAPFTNGSNSSAPHTKIPTFGFHSRMGSANPDVLMACAVIFSCFVIQSSGIKITRIVMYFAVLLPYVGLSILFIRGVTQGGGVDGLRTILSPDFEKLLLWKTWLEAATLSIVSTAAGFGYNLKLASRNKFDNNPASDCFTVILVDTITSVVGAFIVFTFVGEISEVTGRSIDEVFSRIEGASDLLFQVIPDSLSRGAGPRFYMFTFFFSIFLLGFSSIVVAMMATVDSINDEFASWFPPKKNPQSLVNFTFTSWGFVISLFTCTRGGMWQFMFLGAFSLDLPICIADFVALIAIVWIWGLKDLCNASTAMIGHPPGLLLRLCWKFLCPTCLLISGILQEQQLADAKEKDYHFQGVVAGPLFLIFGKIIAHSSVFIILLYLLYAVFHQTGDSVGQKLMLLTHPTYDHKKIRAGEFVPSRSSFEHLFYIGWGEGWRSTTEGVADNIHTTKDLILHIHKTAGETKDNFRKSFEVEDEHDADSEYSKLSDLEEDQETTTN